MPKTLLVRAFLLIVVLIALSFAAALAIFRHAVQEPHAKQMAQLVVSTVNLTRAAVLSSAPEWRSALLAELRDAEGMRIQLADPTDVLEPLPDESPELHEMMEEVRERLGDDTRFAAWRNGEEALWVSFHIGGDEFWLALPRERIEHPLSEVLLAWGGVVLLLALLGAYFIARQVARPLKRLAQAAQQVGEGKTPATLPERGAQEVATVSRAFNRMSADLAANERERALVLAGISHDLRTPLARVRLAAELTADASLREGLVADVEQMDSVIQQFLDYARLDESEAAAPTDVAVLIEEVAQCFAAQAKSLALDLQPLPQLAVRPLLLKRALSNLLDNAIKYGGGEISVTLRSMHDGVELSVADCGAGIPEEQRESVKRPFVRLQAARSDAGGSGLGLAIVERAARLHGGAFHLEPREGGGLVARLVLPNR
ncbi:MAG: ATP-binding protein [Gallionella sp.]|jgi:two-component system osmolarity sensor histidine kinase EnvZ|nr:ATP-binding protein [Gallionella sp.]MCK9355457.1 ATP-binding protein [Gallionella sp.]